MLSQTKQTNKPNSWNAEICIVQGTNTLATLTLIILFVANVDIFKKVFSFSFFAKKKNL
jgi:hypothetical protein